MANVIQILFDDAGAGDVPGAALYDSPAICPNIAALAAAGRVFSRLYVASPKCSPSRTSYLTGRHCQYYNMHGVDVRQGGDRYFIHSGTMTVARMARSVGYRTGHFGKWHVGEPGQGRNCQLPTRYGFERVFCHTADLSLGYGYQTYTNAWWFDQQGPLVQVPGFATDVTFAKAINWLESEINGDAEPFYMQIHLDAPHEPVGESIPERDLYSPGTYSEEEIDYYSLMSNADTGLGLLLNCLDGLGVLATTHIMIGSDNGPERRPIYPSSIGSTGGLRGHKRNLWEGGIRIPCIWSGPGVTASTDNSVRWALDWLPTVASIIGADASGYPGSDMLAAVGTRDLFWENQHDQVSSDISGKWAMLRGNVKLMRFQEDGSDDRFFDVSTVTGEQDANELTVGVGITAPEAADMASALDAWWAAIPKEEATNYAGAGPGTEADAIAIINGWYQEEMNHSRVYVAGTSGELDDFESALGSLLSLPETRACAHGEAGVTETAVGSVRDTHSRFGTATVVSKGIIDACCDETLRANCSAPELATIDARLSMAAGERDGD